MARKPTDTVQLKLRFPESLRRRLERAAAPKNESMNAEIVHRLEESFRTEDLYGGPQISALFRVLASHIAFAKANVDARDWAKNDRVRDEIAQVVADLLVKNLPQFYSVAIDTVDPNGGGKRGVIAYASEENAEREHPGLAEAYRRLREIRSSSSEHTEREDLK
jgi:Arc-like DNA binding domain